MSEIGFGTAPLAFRDIPAEQAVATIHAALDHGVRLIDTALAYTRPGVESYAEAVVARALAGRDGVVVATKGGHYRAGDDFPVDARPAALRANCEVSLRALGVDTIDLYQPAACHMPSYSTAAVDRPAPTWKGTRRGLGLPRGPGSGGRGFRLAPRAADLRVLRRERRSAPDAAREISLSGHCQGQCPLSNSQVKAK